MTRRHIDHAALTAHFERRAAAKMYEIDDGAAPAPQANTSLVLAPRKEITVTHPAWMEQPVTVIAEGWAAPVVTQTEHSDPMSRAKATGLRMLAWGVIWLAAGLLACVILAMIGAELPYAGAAGALLWVVATAVTGYKIARLDHDVSAGGVERHRIDKGYDLAREQLRHEYSLKRLALDTYIKCIELNDRRLEDKRR